jgi:hypothetical protein
MRQWGFQVASVGYHDHLPEPMVMALAVQDNQTAEAARFAPDLLAVHEPLGLTVYVEAKTHRSQRYHDLTTEARQFAERIVEADRGVLCLFAYCDPGVREVGFWMHQLPPVREVRLPSRWTGETRRRYEATFGRRLPGVRIIPMLQSKGSDTPFVVIDETVLETLPDWREQVRDLVEQAGLCGGGQEAVA